MTKERKEALKLARAYMKPGNRESSPGEISAALIAAESELSALREENRKLRESLTELHGLAKHRGIYTTRHEARNEELQAALSPSGEAPTCKICNHAKHTERCEKDAPNAQFRCACAGECQHGKDALYCRDCKGEAPKEGKE